MKYIISESRMTKLVSTFLDQYDWYAWDSTGDGDLSVYDKVDDKKIFYTGFYGDFTETGKAKYILWINNNFFYNVLGKFLGSLNPWDIVKWFNDKFDMDCVDYDFFEPEEDAF